MNMLFLQYDDKILNVYFRKWEPVRLINCQLIVFKNLITFGIIRSILSNDNTNFRNIVKENIFQNIYQIKQNIYYLNHILVSLSDSFYWQQNNQDGAVGYYEHWYQHGKSGWSITRPHRWTNFPTAWRYSVRNCWFQRNTDENTYFKHKMSVHVLCLQNINAEVNLNKLKSTIFEQSVSLKST